MICHDTFILHQLIMVMVNHYLMGLFDVYIVPGKLNVNRAAMDVCVYMESRSKMAGNGEM